MSRGDQRIKEWKQLKGAVLPYSFDFNPFADAHALTISAISASSDKTTVASVNDQTTNSNIWYGNVTGVEQGTADITVTATFTSSNIVRKRRFRVEITDPDF